MKRTEMVRTGFKPAEPKPSKGPKQIACKNRACRKRFVPDRPFIRHCSDDCAVVLGLEAVAKRKAAKEKEDRAETKKKLATFKKRGDFISEAQTAFNAYIRYRDRDQPCICCGSRDATTGVGGGWDAGHWISRGHASHLRFDERNVHRQRKGCNRPGGTTRAKFRIGLVARIGLEQVEQLEALEYAPATKMWSIDECKQIKATYVTKLRLLKEQS